MNKNRIHVCGYGSLFLFHPKLIFDSNKIKSFLVQQFFKNAAEVKGE
jgi:hypothetical protein